MTVPSAISLYSASGEASREHCITVFWHFCGESALKYRQRLLKAGTTSLVALVAAVDQGQRHHAHTAAAEQGNLAHGMCSRALLCTPRRGNHETVRITLDTHLATRRDFATANVTV